MKQVIKEKYPWMLLILLAIVMLIIIGGIATLTHAEPVMSYATDYNELELYVSQSGSTQKIKIWQAEDGTYYFFLPSYVNEQTVVTMANLTKADSVSIEQINYKVKDNLLEKLEWGKTYSMQLSINDVPMDTKTVVFMKSENLPSVYIETESGTTDAIHSDKEVFEQAKVTVRNASGGVEYDNKIEHIRTRGNSSFWETDKKSYQLKLHNKAEMLGMAKAKRWLLVSNYVDNSLLRNHVVYNFANEYTQLSTVEGKYVDLYMNGEYMGNYYLCEKVEVADNRLELEDLEASNEALNTEKRLLEGAQYQSEDGTVRAVEGLASPEDITGGYLVRHSDDGSFEECRSAFKTEHGYVYEVMSPENATIEEVEFIQACFNEAEAALWQEDGINPNTGKHFSEYIDVESWAMRYLVEEAFHNPDGRAGSVYFYKEAGNPLLYAGPLWDYDRALGSYGAGLTHMDHPEGIGYYTLYAKQMLNHSQLKDVLVEGFETKVYPYVQSQAQVDLKVWEKQIEASAQMNMIRWPETRDYYDSFEASVDYVYHFLQERMEYLKDVWVENDTYHTVTFLDYNGNTCAKYTVKHGEYVPQVPEVATYGAIFNGWSAVDTHNQFDITLPVLEDATYQSAWIEVFILLENGINIAEINVKDIDLDSLEFMVESIKERREVEEVE